MHRSLSNLSSAIDKKQRIINNTNDRNSGYYVTSERQYKETTRVIGFKGSPKVHIVQEVKFNHDKFGRDVDDVDHQIEQCKQEIALELGKLSKVVSDLQSEFNNTQATYSNLQDYGTQEETKKKEQTKKLNETNTKIYNCDDRLRKLGIEIIRTQDHHNGIEVEVKKLSVKLFNTQKQNKVKLEEQADKIKELCSSMTDLQRSAILLLLWKQKDQDSQMIVDGIKHFGLDVNYVTPSGDTLIGYAAKNNDFELLDLVMSCQINFNLEYPTINGKNLLQYAVDNNQLTLVNKIITKISEQGVVPSRTLLNAMNNNDLKMIDMIFNHFSKSEHTIYQGYTLLQLAVMSDKEELVEKIISFDITTLQDKNYKGKTALKIALEKGNKSIINKVLKGLDFTNEVMKLIKDNEIDLLITLFESQKGLINQIDGKILYHLLAEQNSEMARALLENGMDVSETVSEAVLQHNPEIIKSLLALDKDALKGAKIDQSKLNIDLQLLGLGGTDHNLAGISVDDSIGNQHNLLPIGEALNNNV